MKTLETKLISWLKAKIKESGAKGLICGLSGGVDSSVVAGLMKKAVAKNHLCLIMPCHSVETDAQDAYSVARKFGLNVEKVQISEVYNTFLKILPEGNDLAKANLKPRLRMITLYYFANKLNYLVVGTGNKSELLMGYFTKYGDGGVDLLPLGNLLKKDVRQLAAHLGVPQNIIDKPPSAGLWHGQTDEGEMGITYNQLDSILEDLQKNKKPKAPKPLVDKVKKKMKISGHKREGAGIFK